MKAFHSLLSLLERPARRTRTAVESRKWEAPSAWSSENKMMRTKFDVMRLLAQTVLYPLACVALTTVLLLLALKYTALEFDLIIYLIPVVICAVRWGRDSSIMAIFASAAVADFLLIPPIYSFAISDPKQIVELALFVFVALVTSHLAARLRSDVDTLQRREFEIHNLYEFSRRLASCATADDLLRAIQDYLSAHLGCEAYLIHLASSYAGSEDAEDERVPLLIAREAKDMVSVRESSSRLVTDPNTNSLWALKYIATAVTGHGVLAISLDKFGGPDINELNKHIDALLSEAGATLMRIDVTAALAKANMRLESEALKTALIDTASHELRSPVAAILGSASVLDQLPGLRDDEKVRSLVGGMHYEAERLDNDIQSLLDMVRIAGSGVTPHVAWTDLTDILSTAIRQRLRRIAAHKLTLDVDPELPLLNVDPALLEQAVGQLIENAVKYSPAGSEITIAARAEDGEAVLSITDRGDGLTAEEANNLFQRAYRGRRHLGNVPGFGLGLWIAWIFVAANGGTLSAHSPGPGLGTTMSIRFPLPSNLAPEPTPSSDEQAR